MRKTLKDIYTIIKNELETNQALTSWANTNFGIQPKIIFGLDEEDLQETDNLEIHIIPGSRNRTRQFAYRSYNITISAIVKKEGAEYETDNNSKFLSILQYTDEFICLIEEALIPVLNRNSIIVTPVESEDDAIGYPYAIASLSYLLEVQSILS